MTTTNRQPATVMPADHIPGPCQGQWTYAHYAALPDDGNRYEVLDGVLYMAPPSPFKWHQGSVVRLTHYLFAQVELKNLGHVYVAPFDVQLSEQVIVEPDVLVVLHGSQAQITASRIIGAPDLVIEVLSPGTATYDRTLKRAAYARAGVREYWLVEPLQHTVEVLVLEKDTYTPVGIFSGTQHLTSSVLSDFPVQVQQFFV